MSFGKRKNCFVYNERKESDNFIMIFYANRLRIYFVILQSIRFVITDLGNIHKLRNTKRGGRGLTMALLQGKRVVH